MKCCQKYLSLDIVSIKYYSFCIVTTITMSFPLLFGEEMSLEPANKPTPADVARTLASRVFKRTPVVLCIDHSEKLRTLDVRPFGRTLPGIGTMNMFQYHGVSRHSPTHAPFWEFVQPLDLQSFVKHLQIAANLRINILSLDFVQIEYGEDGNQDLAVDAVIAACVIAFRYDSASSIAVLVSEQDDQPVS
jgi:hypothetical protein